MSLITTDITMDSVRPPSSILFLGISTTYLLLVEAAKRKFFAASHHQATSLAEAAK